jgi:nitroimidazol reductase NimA-like FMN-containing flavoprotein (pyridoxamine 5'-phosphate oxidase superfamily)
MGVVSEMSEMMKDARLERYKIITGEEANEKIVSILNASDVGRLALLDDRYPYIIPMNHFFYQGGLIMHGSFDGKKIELIERNGLSCYEVDYPLDTASGVVGLKSCHREYESAIFYGETRQIKDKDERFAALKALTEAYGMPLRHGTGVEERCNVLFFDIHEATARTGRFIPGHNKKLYVYQLS